jgi:hypothetical protein
MCLLWHGPSLTTSYGLLSTFLFDVPYSSEIVSDLGSFASEELQVQMQPGGGVHHPDEVVCSVPVFLLQLCTDLQQKIIRVAPCASGNPNSTT